MADSIDNIIRKYCLANAVDHDGTANAKSVLGKVLAERPDLRSQSLFLRLKIERTADEVNKLSMEEQRKELKKTGGIIVIKREKRQGLPDLGRKDSFIARFAPNPDGALHMGNARPAVLVDEYVKRYKGKFILRFDDTDPKIKIPEKQFYKWAKEDMKWLSIRIHKEITASRRLSIYYKHAEELIRQGGAYVCLCGERWKQLRDKSKPCPCRRFDSKENMKLWKRMLTHKYKEGEAVLRLKTDMEAKNPAVRDWPAFRIVDKPHHPLIKRKYVWPLYNFASAIDDYLLKITHIFRGQEHSTNEVKQRYLYQHMGWTYPEVVILGRFSMSDMVLSKSQIREGIARRIYSGWDDPRIGTLRALRRRGFTAEAIRKIIVDIGPKPSDITISLENLSAYNRKIIDSRAKRYFFVSNPKKIRLKNMRLKKAKIPYHPEKKMGNRLFSLGKVFYIDTKDFESYDGLEVRLKDLCNVKMGLEAEVTGYGVKSIPKIQWVPEKHVSVIVIMSDKRIEGYAETNLRKAKKGDIVQFERFGFVRVEKLGTKQIVVIFAHE